MISLAFTEADMHRAAEEWGCNCGPSALAAALGVALDEVRPLIPGFEKRGYTSPTMMKQGVAAADRCFVAVDEWPQRGVVRIQFTGPWTQPGANPRWAYWYTHWVASFRDNGRLIVFDCNCGLQTYEAWQQNVVPEIARSIKRADGGWHATHRWQLQ